MGVGIDDVDKQYGAPKSITPKDAELADRCGKASRSTPYGALALRLRLILVAVDFVNCGILFSAFLFLLLVSQGCES